MYERSLTFLCTLLLPVWVQSAGEESRLVKISHGSVRGYRDIDGDLFAFYGIPYATAPTGTNKFKAPLPPPVWVQPLEAVNKGIICPQGQLLELNTKDAQQEDCLIANLFVPDTEEKNLPVLVVVHGGAFQLGQGNWFTPKILARTKRIITVTFNYRLGIHGFLCLGTQDAPGNAGMKDQVALLRWVKQNIASFGGNPDDVTVSGYSAGAASVDLLMLSKSARGLFRRVIPESGSALAAFAIQSDPLANAKYFAKQNNFSNVDDIYALEKFYTTASFELLTSDTFIHQTDSTFVFSPCVERNDTGEEVFLDDSPLNILKRDKYEKITMLNGFTNMEGLMRLDIFDTWKHKMNENFSEFLPADLIFESEKQKAEVAKTVKEFYFGDQPVSDNNILAYIDYFTDVIFAYPALRSIKLQVEGDHNQIYLYEYSFVDDDVPLVPHTNVRGATHCAQTMAVFDGANIMQPDESSISVEFKKIKSTMRELWSNFITTSKPVPEGSSLPSWPPVKENWSPHMSLGQTVELRGSLLERRARFWDDIYQRFYRNPISPPTPPPQPPRTEL